MTDDISFDESKARELVYFLLKNDINFFKKLIPDIKTLNSESFKNLFQGIPFKNNANDESGYNYNVKNKKMFQKLLNKFNNFNAVLDSWYKDKKYYQYLKEIWVKYINLKNLKGKDDKELENFFKSNKDYVNWPEDIKEEFKILISSNQDKRIIELKNIIDNKFSEFNFIIEKLISFKETIKDIPDIKIYEINAQYMIIRVLETVMIPIAICSLQGMNATCCQKIKSFQKLVYNNNDYEISETKYLAECLLEKTKGQKGSKIFKYKVTDPSYIIEEIRVKCTEEKIDNLNISQKAKALLKRKWVLGINAILSFLNLGYSVYEITQAYKGFKEKNYNKSLNEIRTSFNIHKKELGILPEDFEESIKKMNEVYNKIREDQKILQNLIEDIMNSIKSKEAQKTKEKASLATSITFGIFSVIGVAFTRNLTSVIYGISGLANVISAYTNGTNIYMSNEIIKGLNEVLEQAIKIYKLIQELNLRMAVKPKFFELNEPYTSK